ncbi:hypothetical protein GE061_004493 [Apolygus lucorum]|uniref:Centrosome-associated protein 350-like n=1 Tax=Apolygus lucorum TaxID=248454 RepID=A0A8S9X1Z7_APOLU|nr:hypothetical protein GE061_004493 [Apolygus lucorum]
MNDGSPGRTGGHRNVTRSPRPCCVSPDRDIDLRRRFEALKGDLTVATAKNANADSHQKQPLTLADIQGSIAKRHTNDLANAQRKWIESLNLQSGLADSGPSEEDAQKEWINHISVQKATDRPSRRDGQAARRSLDRGSPSEYRTSIPSPKSSAASSPNKAPRNFTVRSTVLTPGAPTFGFCDVPHLTINSLPVTATSVRDVGKPDKEFITECGKTIKMLKLEEPPKIERKLKGRSPQKMKAVIDLDPSRNESRSNKSKDPAKPQRIFRASLSPKKTKPDSDSNVGSLSPDVVDKYKLSYGRGLVNAKENPGKSLRSKSEHKSPRKLKRSSSLPGGLHKDKVESDVANKHIRSYDVKETRCFIKQKQKEREERLAEEKRKKTIEAEERKKKMQQLRDTQRKIMQKIKKRTVNKIRSPLVIKKDPEKPKWVGPLENTTSALDTSLELVLPKPKTPVLSEAAMGTIVLRKNKDPAPQPGRPPMGDQPKEQSIGTSTAVAPPASTSVATCTTTDEPPIPHPEGFHKSVATDFCLKDLEFASDQALHLKRPAPQLVETSTQIDFDEKTLTKKHKTGKTSSHSSSKGSKHSLPPEIVDKENMGTSDININDLPYSSRLDKFLAEYVPTPKKAEKTNPQPQTPPWLQEMSQYPDQFNLINTLNKALRRQQKLEAASKSPTPKQESPILNTRPSSKGKLHEKGCSLNRPKDKEVSMPLSRASSVSSSSRQSDLDPAIISLTDDRLSSSSLASTSAHSFENYSRFIDQTKVTKNEEPDMSGILPLSANNLTALAGDVTTSDLSALFPQSSKKSMAEISKPLARTVDNRVDAQTIEILGEKFLEPKGVITVRKPLRHRTKVNHSPYNAALLEAPPIDLNSSVHEFVNPKRGSDPLNPYRGSISDLPVTTPSSPETAHSRSTSFSSIKEGSYHIAHSDTRSDDTHKTFEVAPIDSSYHRFIKNIHGTHGPQSEHSSDSVSEIVKVSRTVSRGSTVISEEVSEMQNTLSVSTKNLKFNSSSIQNKIKNEIEQLDRVNQSLSSFMESGKIVLSRDATCSSVVQSESAIEPMSQDVVTVKSRHPVLLDDIDASLLAVSKNVLHSREPSGSSLDVSLASANGVDVTKLTVEMFDNLIKDEKLRSEQLVSGLKVRMKSLCNRTRKDLESIESQRKKLIESGLEEEARELKRKQRGHIMKMNEEIDEMQRQRALENKACQERCMLLKQQQQLIKLLLSRRESSVRNSRSSLKSIHMSQLDETVRYVGSDRNSDIIDRKKREYREKEEALRERKKNVEAIVAWKKRLEIEEKSVREMEKMIAQSSFTAPLPESAVERGTSPFTEIKDGVVHDAKTPESRIPASATSQSESEQQNKDYYSDSFEVSSALSETTGLATPSLIHGSSLLNKAMKMPMLKVPLAPRATIIKRRHSSGSDESMLLSQNDTLSEQSDVEVRVSALEQQLRHRKSELAKLKREYQKNQKERLRSTEKNLINQIHLYDSYIEQVKTEIKDLEHTDVKVTKPQIKQPKYSDRRQSDKFLVKTISKESSDLASEAKNNETSQTSEGVSSHDASVLFLDKAPAMEGKTVESQKEKVSSGEVTEKLDQGTYSNEKEEIISDAQDFDAFSAIDFSGLSTDPVLKAAMEKVKIKSMESFRDSESSVSDKDFSIEEIIEKAEQSHQADSSEEILTQTNVATTIGESLATQSQISEAPDVSFVDETSQTRLETAKHEEDVLTYSIHGGEANKESTDHPSVKDQANSETVPSISEEISGSTFANEAVKTVSDRNQTIPESSVAFKKTSESSEFKSISEEIENVTQSRTSIETVVNTFSDQVKLPSAFIKYVSDRNKNRESLSGSTVSEKSPTVTSEPKLLVVSPVLIEQVTDLDVSPKQVSGSGSSPFDVNIEEVQSLSLSPSKSPEMPSEAQNSGQSGVQNASGQVQSSTTSGSPAITSAEVVSNKTSLDLSQHVSSPRQSSSSKTLHDPTEGGSEQLKLSGTTHSSQVTSSQHLPSANEAVTDKSTGLDRSNLSPHVSSRSARKRLDMGDNFSVKSDEVRSSPKSYDKSMTGYQPTREIEGGKRSISELIPTEVVSDDIKESSEGSSVSEQIPTDLSGSVIEERDAVTSKSSTISEVIEQVEEEEVVLSEVSRVQSENDSSVKDDSALDKLDFSLGSLDPYRPQQVSHVESSQSPKKDSSGPQSEAGDNCSVKLLVELPEDKKELGQGDEPLRDLEIQSIEADSLEDPFGQDFNSSFNAEEFAKYFESSFEQEPDLNLAPSKPLNEASVIQLLQNSFELSDKIWEENLSMKKSSEETPLLSALQRERQQNVNVDSISQLIFDSFVDDATSAALSAYSKKKQFCSSETGGGHTKDAKSSPDNEVGDNEKFWLGDDFTLQAAHEAEQLRLRELQIQQEIEQLEQAQEVVPYYYVREIPNKPPPPYTPPKPAPPSKDETVSRVLQGGEILWDIEMSGGDPSEAVMPSTFLSNLQDDPYRMFLFDLAKELYLKVKPRPSTPTPPWVISTRRGKPLPPIRSKADLLNYLEKEIKLAFGFNPRILRESLIMKWTRKRRDHVDEILVRELQESEAEWRDFTVEENMIKNRLADALLSQSLDDATLALSTAFANKFKDLTVDQS